MSTDPDTPTTSYDYDFGHPLRSAGLAPGDGDAGVTRPHLARLTRDSSLDPEGEDIERQRATESQEREVIVHKVTPKDSLPGVSLKYGIPLADLRRINQLWTSDSIHLRDVLYIPVEKAARTYSNSLTDPDHHCLNTPSTTIQRIPASQLSYFPPSRTKPRRGRRRSSTDQAVTPSKSATLPRGFMRTQSLHSAPFTSLLTALPFPPSTRDDIVARLSFDSTTSSSDDRSRGQTDSEENHELEDVTTARNVILGFRFSSEDPTTLRNVNHEVATPGINIPHHNVPEYNIVPRVLPTPPRSAYIPPSYIPPSSSFSFVRTVQMEPSPLMQIPKRRNSALHLDSSRRSAVRYKERKAGKGGSSEGMYSPTYDTVELEDTNTRFFG